jgi:putative transposase
MNKGSSKSKQNLETPTPRRRKYDEEFKQQAVAMVRNGQLVRSVAQVRRFTADSNHGLRMSPNLLLERAIKVDRPRQVIVGDITYLTLQTVDWAYLATWMDMFSRKIVGWHLADSMTVELVIEALKKAILRERLPIGMIAHSDRGGQYVDTEFRELLNQHGFEQSMSYADETYDNAHAESLFSRYKAELLEDGAFADAEQAKSETFAYIEGYYNRVRLHSSLGYLNLEDFERAYYQRAQSRQSLSAPRSLSARCETFDNKQRKDVKAKQHWCSLK